MREFALNHASLSAPDDAGLTIWLVGVAQGMASLINGGIAQSVLRMDRQMGDILCRPNRSLFDACASLRSRNRDEYVLLMRLAQKVPLGYGLEPDAADRLLACEGLRPSGEDGRPLLVCAITDGIAVGFPSSPEWDRDQLCVTFEQLLPDGELDQAEEYIDNLTRATHAEAILRRERERLGAGSSAVQVWARRREVFPNLLFGPEVEQHLKQHERLLRQILGKLFALDESARSWTEGPAPLWKTKVTPESTHVTDTPKLSDARLFDSEHGGKRRFLWHARVGNGYRIHFRFDPKGRCLEIGYVGPHLPV